MRHKQQRCDPSIYDHLVLGKPRRDLVPHVVSLLGIWVIAAVRGFDGFVFALAIAWTVQVVLVNWWHPWPRDLFEPTARKPD